MRKMALLGLLAFSDVGTSAAKIVRCPDGDCYSCPAGSWTPNNITPCTQATPGYYVPLHAPVNDPPIPAPPGSYVPGYGATSATLASPGHYVAGSAQSAQTAATAGYYVPNRGATAPIKASLGHYVDGPAATAQAAAPPGSYVPTTGAVAPLLADKGYYVPTAGQSAPTAAAPGSYVATRGATAPTLAAPGYYVAGSAATGQTAAAAGSYVPAAGATGAILAPRGTYVDTAAATAPIPVRPGAFIRSSGSVGSLFGGFDKGGLCFIGYSYGGASACRQNGDFSAPDYVTPKGALSSEALDFGAQSLGDGATLPVSIRNIAAFDTVGAHLTTLSLLSYSFDGDAGFSLAGFTPGMTLEQGEQAIFQLLFQPTAGGLHHGWLTFVTDQFADFGKAGKTFRVELTGTATEVVPPSVVPEPANWGLLITGLGLTGAAMRRRRTVPA